jgi:hypothetical protein
VGACCGVPDADTPSGVLVTDVNCLRLNEVRIPMHTVRDLNARLECHFDLEGEALYSVKWYKDGNEFFRYVPRDQPPAQLFPLPGVTVDVSTHSDLQWILPVRPSGPATGSAIPPAGSHIGCKYTLRLATRDSFEMFKYYQFGH